MKLLGVLLLALIDVRTGARTSGEIPPCPLAGGSRRRVNYRRQEEERDAKRDEFVPMPLWEDLPPQSAFNTTARGLWVTGPPTEGTVDPNATTIRRRTTTTTVFSRTTPFRLSFARDCDYLAYYCKKAYQTGQLCARSWFMTYHTFPNYCLVDYVNCMEKYEIWQVVHMGPCEKMYPLNEYRHYPYHDDYWMDQYYIQEAQG